MGTSFNHRTCHVRYADLQWQKKHNGQKGTMGLVQISSMIQFQLKGILSEGSTCCIYYLIDLFVLFA